MSIIVVAVYLLKVNETVQKYKKGYVDIFFRNYIHISAGVCLHAPGKIWQSACG